MWPGWLGMPDLLVQAWDATKLGLATRALQRERALVLAEKNPVARVYRRKEAVKEVRRLYEAGDCEGLARALLPDCLVELGVDRMGRRESGVRDTAVILSVSPTVSNFFSLISATALHGFLSSSQIISGTLLLSVFCLLILSSFSSGTSPFSTLFSSLEIPLSSFSDSFIGLSVLLSIRPEI